MHILSGQISVCQHVCFFKSRPNQDAQPLLMPLSSCSAFLVVSYHGLISTAMIMHVNLLLCSSGHMIRSVCAAFTAVCSEPCQVKPITCSCSSLCIHHGLTLLTSGVGSLVPWHSEHSWWHDVSRASFYRVSAKAPLCCVPTLLRCSEVAAPAATTRHH